MTICCNIFVGLDFIFECRILKVDRNIVDEKNIILVIVLSNNGKWLTMTYNHKK